MSVLQGVHFTNRTVAPLISPVSLSEIKEHLKIGGTDEDSLIQLYIDAATAVAFEEVGKAMITQTWEETFRNSSKRVSLSIRPAKTIVSVKYYDSSNAEQTATLSDFTLVASEDDAYIESDNWPSAYDRADAYKVTYTAGFGDAITDIPANIRQGIFLLVGQYHQHRMNVEEVALKEVPRAVTSLFGLSRAAYYG